MSWQETRVDEERIRFVVEALECAETMSGLRGRCEISRRTGYKWLNRYREVKNPSNLVERSCRPHRSPGKVSEELEDRIEDLWRAHSWGSRKLWRLLQRRDLLSLRNLRRQPDLVLNVRGRRVGLW